MANPFAALDAIASRAVDGLCAEDLRIEPQIVGEYGAAPDPDRSVIPNVRGIVSTGDPEHRFLSGEGRPSAFLGRSTEARSTVSFDRAVLGSAVLRKGDILVATSRTPVERFALSDPLPCGDARVAFRLVGA